MPRYRPRAPSPPLSPTFSENTYCIVQDNVIPPPPPPKMRHDHRMFGDSVNASPTGSVLSSSSGGSPTHDDTLNSLYRSKHSQGNKKYDAVTVEEIKAQFQKQIETMIESHERNSGSNSKQNLANHPKRQEAPVKSDVKVSINVRQQSSQQQQGLRNGHILSTTEKELSGFRDLERGKSFQEARQAVQKQIEKIFNDAQHPTSSNVNKKEIKHTIHGVSHALPGQEDEDFTPPPPVHYGVNQAIRNGVNNKKQQREDMESNNNNNKWHSVESLLNDSSSLSRNKNKDSDSNDLFAEDNKPVGSINNSDLSRQKKFKSMEHISNSKNIRGLQPRSVTVNVQGEIHNQEVSNRVRKYRMESGKSLPNLSNPQHDDSSSSVSHVSSSNMSAISSEAGLTSVSQQLPQQPPTLPETLRKEYVKHKVDYLGSLPISNRSTNLSALQRPLKDLYFKYRALRNLGQTNLPGTLEINDTGLRIQYIRELHKGVQEIFNPFPTIAVWAAVKFVHRREVTHGGNVHHQFAFLPLISDPDSQERHRLYYDLDFHEVELAADAPHPPVFACVMRRTGVPKQLECHGFVCTSSEDAIIIAANLYQSLLETMKRQKQQTQSTKRVYKAHSGSEASSSVLYSDITPPPTIFSDSDAPNAPIRPPRRKKKSSANPEGSHLQRRKSLRSSIRSNRSNRSTRSRRAVTVTYDPTRKNVRSLARSDSGRKSLRRDGGLRKSGRRKTNFSVQYKSTSTLNTSMPGGSSKVGDVYTKVAIPRSKSFMNVNSQYNLQELFRELKEKEGVDSIDDVLKKIISPNGISFNEIKPVYRELLMKLAMTMSQDELFQRTKNIMSQEKKKNEKKRKQEKEQKNNNNNNNSKSSKKSSSTTPSAPNSSSDQQTGGNTLTSFFKMTFSSSKNNSLAAKDKNNKSFTENSTISSQLSSSKRSSSGYESGNQVLIKSKSMKPLPSLPSSYPHQTSSMQSRILTKADISGPIPLSNSRRANMLPKSTHILSSNQHLAKKLEEDLVDDAYASCSECGGLYESVCTSNFDDTCSTCRLSTSSSNNKAINNNNAKGTYNDSDVYCDECDGESCTSSDKCYCSLRGTSNSNIKIKTRPALPEVHSCNNKTIIHCNGSSGRDTISSITSSSVTTCSTCIHQHSDSGSTATDTTCYSIRPQPVRYHLQQQPANSSLISGCDTPQTAWKRNNQLHMPRQFVGSDHSCSDCSINANETGLNRRNSGGSGYQSNDSFTAPNHTLNGRAVTKDSALHNGGDSSCSSSNCSHHSRKATAQHHNMKRANSKVLLLSAMDKSGNVVYRGSSSVNSTLSQSNVDHQRSQNSSLDEKNILSMKKSAEIAAVFTGVKINQTTDIVDRLGAPSNNDSDGNDSTQDAYDSKRSNCTCGGKYSGSDMHSSLGYFP